MHKNQAGVLFTDTLCFNLQGIIFWGLYAPTWINVDLGSR